MASPPLAFFMVVEPGYRKLAPGPLPWHRSIQGLEGLDPFGLTASNWHSIEDTTTRRIRRYVAMAAPLPDMRIRFSFS